MHKNFRDFLFVFFLGGMAMVAQARGQATPPPAAAPVAPGANAPASAAPAGVALDDVVTTAVADSNILQAIQSRITSDPTVAQVQHDLPALAAEINQRKEDAKTLEANLTPSALNTAQASWQSLETSLSRIKDTLSARLGKLGKDIATVKALSDKWQATLSPAAKPSSAISPDITARIKDVAGQAAGTLKAAQAQQLVLLSLQNLAADQDARITAGMGALKNAQENATKLLFVRNADPVWNLQTASLSQSNPTVLPQHSLARQAQEVEAYLAVKFPTVLIQLLIFVAATLVLFWLRKEIRIRAHADPAIRRASRALEAPIAMAALIALVASQWLYPLPPHLFTAVLWAVALVPAVILLRLILERSLFPILYAMVVFYFFDQLRYVAMPIPLLSRILLLVELIAASGFILWLLPRSQRLPESDRPGGAIRSVVRTSSRIALVLLCAAALANLLGYTHLSYLVGRATLQSGYLAVILYAGVRIADGLAVSAMKIRPLSSLGMVQRHEALLGSRAALIFRWLAALLWLREALELFWIWDPLREKAIAILTYADDKNTLHASLVGRIILCGLVIWGTFLVSRLIRFILEEEVYPRLKLGRGVPYAASTMVHYVVLIFGFLTALDAVGIDLAKYSILAGAFGVGLGFGMQNIINNFVSGIILLFERPIKVGDIIQVDTAVGTVENIGIRASVIRITDGSEIIMPNGNLVSNPVTNWTFSNRQRVIDLPVTVGPKADPHRVMTLMVDMAKAQPMVLKDPSPQVLLDTFTATAMTFRLRVWTNNYEAWTQIRSELALAISTALTRENIALT